jgi:hypothetical protein
MSWIGMPCGPNHPAYVKFVVFMKGNCKIKRRLGGSGPQGPGSPNMSKIISMCWMNLPFGQNHPAYIKFVVSKSFAITS